MLVGFSTARRKRLNLLVKHALEGSEIPESSELLYDLVGNYVYNVTEGEHIDLRGLFNRLDKTKCLVHRLARAVDTVVGPHNETEFFHFLCRSLADFVSTANHTGKNAHAVGENNDSLGVDCQSL